MHIALWTTGIAALIFLVLTIWAARATTAPDDAIMGSFVTLAMGALAGLNVVAWLILIIIKAASA